MISATHSHRLRGFSLLETVLVLALTGAMAVAFVAVLGNSSPMSTALVARTAASTAADTVATVWQANGAAPGGECAAAVPAQASASAHNGPLFANPCELERTNADVSYVGATTGVTQAQVVSVATAATAEGWQVAVVAAEPAQTGETVATCAAIVRDLPSTVERYLTFPAVDSACSAAGALDVDRTARAAGACPGELGQSWRNACPVGSQ